MSTLDREVEVLFDAVGKWAGASNHVSGGLASGGSSTGVSFSQRCLQSPPASTAALLSTIDAFNEAAGRGLSLHSFYFGFTRRGKWRIELDSGKVHNQKSESVDLKTQNSSGAQSRQPPPPPPLSLALISDLPLTGSSGNSFSPQGLKPLDKDRGHYMNGGRSNDFGVISPTASTPRGRGCVASASASTDSPRRSSIADSRSGGGGGMAVPRSPRRHIDVTDPITGVLKQPMPNSGRGNREINSGRKGVEWAAAGGGTTTALGGIGMVAIDTFGRAVGGVTDSRDLSPSLPSRAPGATHVVGDSKKAHLAEDGEVGCKVEKIWVTLEVPLLCLSRPLQWNEPFSASRESVGGRATLAMLVQLVIDSAAPILLTLSSTSFSSPAGTSGSFEVPQGGVSSLPTATTMTNRLALALAKALQRLLLLPIGESIQQRTVLVPSSVAGVMPQGGGGERALGAEGLSVHTLQNVSKKNDSFTQLAAADGNDDDEAIDQPRPALEYLLLPLPVPRGGGAEGSGVGGRGGAVVASPQQTTNTSVPHLNMLATIPFQLSDALYAAFRVVLAHAGLLASYPSGSVGGERSKEYSTAASIGESSASASQTPKSDPLGGLLPSIRSLSLFWSCCASASNSAITPLYAKKSAVVEGFSMALMSGVDVLRPLGELLWIGLERAVNDFESTAASCNIFGSATVGIVGNNSGLDTIEDTSRGQRHRSTNDSAAAVGIPSPPPRHLSLNSKSATTRGGVGSPVVPIPPPLLLLPPYPIVIRIPVHNTCNGVSGEATKARTVSPPHPSHHSDQHSSLVLSIRQQAPPVPAEVMLLYSLLPSQVTATYSWTAVAMGALSALQVLCTESSIARRGVRDTSIDVPLPFLMAFRAPRGREAMMASGGSDAGNAALHGNAAEDDGERDAEVQRKRKQKASTPLSIIADYTRRLAVIVGGGGEGHLLDASSPLLIGSSCFPLLLRLTSCLQVLTRDLDTCRWLCCDPASGGPLPNLVSFDQPLADTVGGVSRSHSPPPRSVGDGDRRESAGRNSTCLNTLLYLISTVGGGCSELTDDRAGNSGDGGESGARTGEGVRLRVTSLLLTSAAGVLQNMARDPESAAKLRKSDVVEVLLEKMLLRPLGKGGEGEGRKKGSQSQRRAAEGTMGTMVEAAGHEIGATLKKGEEEEEEEVTTNKEDLLNDYVCEMQVAAIKVILNLHEGDATSRAQLKSLLSLAVAEYHLQDVFLC